DIRTGADDEEGRWARWNWLAVALLPIAWSFSVVPLALTMLVLFRRRRWLSAAISCTGSVPLMLSGAIDPAIPTFVCITGVGLGLAVEPIASLDRLAWARRSPRPLRAPKLPNRPVRPRSMCVMG